LASVEDLDRLVLTEATARWVKVARIVARVGQSEIDLDTDKGYQLIADRIVALVSAGELEAQGDLTNWRFSEVRLPPRPRQQ